jgi:ligand-binding sensor domain-containing protein
MATRLRSRAEGNRTDPFYQVLQDHRAYLWFTTRNGLVRYDSYQHVLYPSLPTTVTLENPDPRPGILYEDRNGTLWVATEVLTRFDPGSGTFTAISLFEQF